MNETKSEYILVRGPRTNNLGITSVTVKMVRAAETDLSEYSFLVARDTYEEWVPTKELHLYQKVLK